MTRIQFHNRTLVVADSTMQRCMDLAERASKSGSPVLLVGESGTGKELIARFIHEKGARKNCPFVSVNCAAIPEGLMEAELFGYERGAFTGAVSQRIGKFERANLGTILLDEISEMTTSLQAKLLRVLQENEVDRIGGRDPIRINARVIATTNRDPLRLISEGVFREDLYYRLNVIRIECEPLRGREKAIETLCQEFLLQASNRQERKPLQFSEEAMKRLLSHSWPGNIRELQNVMESAVLMCDGEKILPEHLSFSESYKTIPQKEGLLADVEQGHIMNVLQKNNGNRTHAADELGISIRTLRNKLKLYRTA